MLRIVRSKSAISVALTVSLAMAGCSKTEQTPPQQAGGGDSAGRRAGGGGGGRASGGRGAGGPVPVVTTKAVAKPVPVIIPAVGTAEPVATVQVRAQVTGQLSQIHFREGQDVRKGDPLFTLDARPFQAALQQAEAVLARDTAQAKNAQAQRSRYQDLFNRGLIPRDQYETQMANAAALEATLSADQAALENARVNLQYTRIVAPIAGRTGSLGVHQGDLVRANDTAPMVVINQVSPIYVTFSVPGRYLPDIRRYQGKQPLHVEARVSAAGTPGAPQTAPASAANETMPSAGGRGTGTDGAQGATTASADPGPAADAIEPGKVSFIDNTVDPTTGTIRLKATFENADHALWPGLFVQVNVILRTDPSATVVPAVAVQSSQTGQFVYVVTADRTAQVRDVVVERQQGDDVVIAKGVSAGDEVVTDGQLRLTPGAHVVTGTRGEGAGGAGGSSGSEGRGRRGGRGRQS
jgi:membrane fusion protein, multidrug efflux system